MLNATRFVLRLATESAYLCLDLGISLCVDCHMWGLAHVVKRAWAVCLYGKSP